MNHKKKRFAVKVLVLVLAVFTTAVIAISLITYMQINSAEKSKTDASLDMFTDRIMAEMNHLEIILDSTREILSDEHIAIAKAIDYILRDAPQSALTAQALQRLAEPLDILEINIADSNGILTHSSNPELIGFDYSAFEVTRKYMALIDGTETQISEEPRRSVFDDDEFGDINHYTAVARTGGGLIQLGFNAGIIEYLHNEINIARTIKETIIGYNGYGMIIFDGVITAHPKDAFEGTDVSGEIWYQTVSSSDGHAWIEIDNARYYAGFKNSGGYTVIGLIPQADFYRESRNLLIQSAVILIIATLIMIPIIFMTVDRLMHPIDELVAGIKTIADGDFGAKIEGRYDDEFDDIKNAVNNMAGSIQSLFREQTEKQEKIMALEREMMQKQISVMLSQIQPHFLYNSLAAIQELCIEDPEGAKQAITEFSGYLRGNLDSLSFTQPISFERELEHIETYLALEKKRFGDKLNVIYDTPVTDFTLPALSLQPIVENAVRHGVAGRSDGGNVTIATSESDSSYIITVADDGVGFDSAVKKNDKRLHVGIENVRKRLEFMCSGTLTIKSVPDEGTTAEIKIPKYN